MYMSYIPLETSATTISGAGAFVEHCATTSASLSALRAANTSWAMGTLFGQVKGGRCTDSRTSTGYDHYFATECHVDLTTIAVYCKYLYYVKSPQRPQRTSAKSTLKLNPCFWTHKPSIPLSAVAHSHRDTPHTNVSIVWWFLYSI